MQISNMQYNETFWSPGTNKFETATMNIPQVIGEGDVISYVSPDGIIQYFFMPISQWQPYAPNSTIKYNYNNFNPNVTSWFVRSISNPLPSALFNYPQQRPSTMPFSTVTSCYNSECNFNITNPGFQLKFHNDKWTSSTDLYYFYPGLRQCNWIPSNYKGNAAVQVDLPVLTNTICHCEVISNKPCHCPTNPFLNKSQNDVGHFTHKESCMSIEDVQPKDDMEHTKSNKQCKKKLHIARKSNKTHVFCECEKIPPCPDTSDKLVTTYADQKCGCSPEIGRETQTIFRKNSFTNTTSRKGKDSKNIIMQPELWHPKTSYAEKGIKLESSTTEARKNDSSSEATSESCDCNSETE